MRQTGLFISAFLLIISNLPAQSDSLPRPAPTTKPVLITAARQELKAAFLSDDPAWAALWVDSLARMEDDKYIGLIWDERWLLYYWEESYGNLFEEVSQFDLEALGKVAKKNQPRGDSLFETIDRTLFEQRYDLFSKLQTGFLNTEEKAFASLLLEYLLRMNKDAVDWNRRVLAFLKLYPESRFTAFLKSSLQEAPEPVPVVTTNTPNNFGLALELSYGTWTGVAQRTLRPDVSFVLDLAWLKRRRILAFDLFIGGGRTNRILQEDGFILPKDSGLSSIGGDLQWGYNIVNNRKLRIQPAVVGGIMVMLPRSSDDDTTLVNAFTFGTLYLGTALHIDVKLGKLDSEEDMQRHYHGIRLTLGNRWLNFGNNNDLLQGNMLYLAVGYALR